MVIKDCKLLNMDRNRVVISPKLRAQMLEVAWQFRKELTSSEEKLWQVLRNRQLSGLKFRRQQPIGPFIVDFYCSEERLIVEVDGPIHEFQQQADLDRQRLLESLDLRFVRITTNDIECNIQMCIDAIKAVCTNLSPSNSIFCSNGNTGSL